MRTLRIIVLGLLLAFLPSFLFSQKQIDPSLSFATFTVTNLGLDVDGKIRGMTGEVSFDPMELEESNFQVSLPVKSIRTGNRMRDDHLKEEEFFHEERYPEILFQSSKVEQSGKDYLMTGRIRIRGVEKQVQIPFSYDSRQFTGTLEIDRNDFQLGDSGFIDTIGDKVKIEINCTLLN